MSQLGYLHPEQTHSDGELPQSPSLDRHQNRLEAQVMKLRWLSTGDEAQVIIDTEKFNWKRNGFELWTYSEGYLVVVSWGFPSWKIVCVPNQRMVERRSKNVTNWSPLEKPKFLYQGAENIPERLWFDLMIKNESFLTISSDMPSRNNQKPWFHHRMLQNHFKSESKLRFKFGRLQFLVF